MVCTIPSELQYVEFPYVRLAEGSNQCGKIDVLTSHKQSTPDISSLEVTKTGPFIIFSESYSPFAKTKTKTNTITGMYSHL